MASLLSLLTGSALLIRRNLQQASIDHQYSPSQWSNRLAKDGSKQFTTPDDVVFGEIKGNHVSTVSENSALVRNRHSDTADLHVEHEATRSKESTMDIYYQQSRVATHAERNGDIVVYIHGGYWQALDKKSSCFFADTMLHKRNCSAFVAVGYDLCPTVPFRVLVHQVKSAVAHVLRSFPNHRIHVVGHSAGGHLGAELLLTNWSADFNIPEKKPASYCLVSGVYDLQPIYRSYVNEQCQMSEQEAIEFSPSLQSIQHITERVSTTTDDTPPVPIIIAVGEHDSPAFRQQSRDFYTLLTKHTNAVVTFLEMPGEDHFTSIERLDDEQYVLSESIRVHLLMGV